MKINKSKFLDFFSSDQLFQKYQSYLSKGNSSVGRGIDQKSLLSKKLEQKLFEDLRLFFDLSESIAIILIQASYREITNFDCDDSKFKFINASNCLDLHNLIWDKPLFENNIQNLLPQNILVLDFEAFPFMPQGISLCIGEKETFEKIEPLFFGGGMVGGVDLENFSCKKNIEEKFWAGTHILPQLIIITETLLKLQAEQSK